MSKHVKVYCYTDGGCRGNQGPGAICVLILDKSRNKIATYSECIGETTNNRAEYRALIKALELTASHCRKEVNCFLDSELVVRQVSGRYAIKNKELLRLFYLLKDRERSFDKVTYTHVKRSNKYIKMADAILNRILDAE